MLRAASAGSSAPPLPPLRGDQDALEAMGEAAAGLSPRLDSAQDELELEQERQMLEVLELSVYEMKNTVTELEKRLNNVKDEDNEWKTRYETQIELNRQLERQIGLLQGKMESVRGSPTDRLASVRSFDQMHLDSLNQFLKQLEEERKGLQNQLKDYELRLEQEAKAYHKANDERRAYFAVIAQLTASLKSPEKQNVDTAEIKREKKILKGQCNIPKNQRILDPKKGPIKKTAGVKQLPKLKL